MNPFQEAISNAYDALLCVAGVSVTYHRGTDWVELTAIEGSTTFAIDDGQGVVIDHVSRDYVFSACDLVLAGSETTPKRGDLIKIEVGPKLYTHEVLRPDSGEVWRYSDLGRSKIRVHTKLKGVANV